MTITISKVLLFYQQKLCHSGAEKLLEVWFNNDSMVDAKSLRVIPEAEWIALLDLAQCQILSRRKNEKLDAYVLRYIRYSVM
jgi:hypothetical protein